MTETAIATTATELILAIDLGKYKSVVCLYRNVNDTRFIAFPTPREKIERLFERQHAKIRDSRLPLSGGTAWPRRTVDPASAPFDLERTTPVRQKRPSQCGSG